MAFKRVLHCPNTLRLFPHLAPSQQASNNISDKVFKKIHLTYGGLEEGQTVKPRPDWEIK